MFARLFGNDDDQILIMLDQEDDGRPTIDAFFQPSGLGICSFSTVFEASDDGWEKAQFMLRNLSEEQVRTVAAEVAVQYGSGQGESGD